jgi:hypothetical protein
LYDSNSGRYISYGMFWNKYLFLLSESKSNI